ncbi:MAG TPA: HPF/RaiA family ribosome-associated protein [Holophagaceae bacterium]|nr:HPF/RaiA family ribosome-associated protein [Holophagaceae bacterium]
MQIDLKGQGVRFSEALRAHAHRRLAFALSRFEPSLRRVRLHLEDMNGPKGGVDKRCRVVLHLVNGGQVLAEDASADAYDAISGAVERALRGLTRGLERLREGRG